MKFLPFVPALGILIVGCGGGTVPKPTSKTTETKNTKITAANQRSLFPFAEGNKWTFGMEVELELAGRSKQVIKGELMYKMTKVIKDSPTASRAIIEVWRDEKKQDEQEWGVDDKGIYQISMKGNRQAYSPKQPVIRFPVKDQDTFQWEGSGMTPISKPGTMKYVFKADGMQMVDTDMGTLNGLFMQSGGTFKASDGTPGGLAVNAWFGPGIGLLRYRQLIRLKGGNTTITLRLKSYTVKK